VACSCTGAWPRPSEYGTTNGRRVVGSQDDDRVGGLGQALGLLGRPGGADAAAGGRDEGDGPAQAAVGGHARQLQQRGGGAQLGARGVRAVAAGRVAVRDDDHAGTRDAGPCGDDVDEVAFAVGGRRAVTVLDHRPGHRGAQLAGHGGGHERVAF
jgi:hypothetical protein